MWAFLFLFFLCLVHPVDSSVFDAIIEFNPDTLIRDYNSGSGASQSRRLMIVDDKKVTGRKLSTAASIQTPADSLSNSIRLVVTKSTDSFDSLTVSSIGKDWLALSSSTVTSLQKDVKCAESITAALTPIVQNVAPTQFSQLLFVPGPAAASGSLCSPQGVSRLSVLLTLKNPLQFGSRVQYARIKSWHSSSSLTPLLSWSDNARGTFHIAASTKALGGNFKIAYDFVLRNYDLQEQSKSSDKDPKPVKLNRQFHAAVCTVTDLTSYDVFPGYEGTGHQIGASKSFSLDKIQEQCDKTNCVGFTTKGVAMSDGTVIDSPISRHKDSRGMRKVSDPTGTKTTFFRKPVLTELKCCFTVDTATATIDILLEQAMMSTGQAEVYVNGAKFKTCGKNRKFVGNSKKFSNSDADGNQGMFGTDGDCGHFLLCTTLTGLQRGDVVTVFPADFIPPSACDASLRVLVNITASTISGSDVDFLSNDVDTNGVTQMPTPLPASQTYAPLTLTAAPAPSLGTVAPQALKFTRAVGLRKNSGSSNSDKVSFFVKDATGASLLVYQTGFQCNPPCSGGVQQVKFGPRGGPYTHCGGSLGFEGNSNVGASNHCSVSYSCGSTKDAMISLGTSSTYTGFVDVFIDLKNMDVEASLCYGFAGFLTVHAVNDPFPLLKSDGGTLAAAQNDCPGGAAAILAESIPFSATGASANIVFLTQFASSADAYQAWFGFDSLLSSFVSSNMMILISGLPLKLPDSATLNSWMLNPFPTGNFDAALRSQLSGNVAFGCIVDSVGTVAVECHVPIPEKAEFVKVSVAQSDFIDGSVTVFLVPRSGVSKAAKEISTSCGGDNPFLSETGESSNCLKFLTCEQRVIPRNSTNKAEYSTIIISASSGLKANGDTCPVALQAVVEFTASIPLFIPTMVTGAPGSIPGTGTGTGTTGSTSQTQTTIAPTVNGTATSNATQGVVVPANKSTCDSLSSFFCEREARCLSPSTILLPNSTSSGGACDGVNDCLDGSDELKCGEFKAAEADAMFDATKTNGTLFVNVSGMNDCKSVAVTVGATAFVINDQQQRCYTYPPEAVEIAVYTPNEYVIPSNGSTLYIAIKDPQEYRRCTNILHCKDNGIAVNISNFCHCTCNQGWTGEDCSVQIDAAAIGQYVAIFERAASLGLLEWPAQVFHSALFEALSSPAIRFTSEFPERLNDSFISVPFAAVATDTDIISRKAAEINFQQRIFRSDVWAVVNSTCVAAGLPSLAYVSARSTVSQVEQSQCNVTDSGASCTSASRASTLPTARLRASADAAWGSAKISFQVASARRQQNTVTVTCTSNNTATTKLNSVCSRSVCAISLNPPEQISSITISPGTDATNTSAGTCGGVTIDEIQMLGKIYNASNDTATTVVFDPRPQVGMGFGAFVVTVVGCVFLVYFGLGYCAWKRRKLGQEEVYHEALKNEIDRIKHEESKSKVQESSQSKVKFKSSDCLPVAVDDDAEYLPFVHWTVNLLAHNVFHLRQRKEGNWDLTKFITVTSAILAICGLAFGYFIVDFEARSGLAANTNILVSQFLDEHCTKSPYAQFPIVANQAVSSDRCQPVTTIGSGAARLYAKGTCDQANGVARAAFGLTRTECEAKELSAIPLDTCLSKSLYVKDNTQAQFATVQCVSEASATNYMKSLAMLVPLIHFKMPTSPAAISNKIPTPSCSPVNGTVICSYAYLTSRNNLELSTSHHGSRIETMATANFYRGSLNSLALVYQPRPRSIYGNDTLMAQFEESWTSTQADLPLANESLSRSLPLDSDYPVGFVYNWFNTHNEVVGIQPFTTHRYPNMRNTPFDLGAHFGPAQVDDGQGATLTFWLRASSTSEGFVFAMTDNYINTDTKENTLLRLAHLIESTGRSGRDSWIRDYHIYYSVFIDGPSQTLKFIYADPVTENMPAGYDPFGKVEWFLGDIGLQKVFDNRWHQIRLLFTNTNQKIHAQIAVDGDTVYENTGWIKCIQGKTSRFTPIAILPTSVNVSNQMTDVVYQGGVLTVGLFNGGVWGIELLPREIPRGSLWKNNVPDEEVDLNSTAMQFESLSIALFVFGALLFCASLASTYTYWYTQREDAQRKADLAENSYDSLVWPLEFTLQSGYEPLPLKWALRTTGLDAPEFFELIGTICKTTSTARRNILKVIWIARRRASNDPTATWNSLFGRATQTDTQAAHDTGRFAVVNHVHYQIEALLSSEVEPPPVDEWNAFVTECAEKQKAEDEKNKKDDEPRKMKKKKSSTNEPTADFGVTVNSGSSGDDESDDSADADFGALGQQSTFVMEKKTEPNKVYRSARPPSPMNFLEDFTHVLALVAVYVSVLQFPLEYRLTFGRAFGFLSLDWSNSLGMSSMVTPILQMSFALLVMSITAYITVIDNRLFMFNIAQFTRLRDMNDAETHREKQMIKLRSLGLEKEASNEVPENETVLSLLLDPLDRVRVERFIQRRARNDAPAEKPDETLRVKLCDGTLVTLRPRQLLEANITTSGAAEQGGAKVVSEIEVVLDDGSVQPLVTLGARCPVHGCVLQHYWQNDVFPYNNRATCCACEWAAPCNQSAGDMWVCGEQSYDDDGNVVNQCGYALCAKHWQPSMGETILSRLTENFRSMQRAGTIGKLISFLLSVSYIPLSRTVLMVLACHPFYICTFGLCWASFEYNFFMSRYAVIITLSVYCALLPLVQAATIYYRYILLRRVFRRDPEEISTSLGRNTEHTQEGKLKRKSSSSIYEADGTVDLVQWERFLASDHSALSPLYNQLLPDRMAWKPVQLILRFILVLPAILLEPNTPTQLLGIGIAEILYAIVVVLWSPYMTPSIDMTQRAGAAHQLFLLAFQAQYAIEEAAGRMALKSAGSAMLAVTSVYIFVMVAYFIRIVFSESLERWWTRRIGRSNHISYGLVPLSTTPLFCGMLGSAWVIRSSHSSTKGEDDELLKLRKKRALEDERPKEKPQVATLLDIDSDDEANTGASQVSPQHFPSGGDEIPMSQVEDLTSIPNFSLRPQVESPKKGVRRLTLASLNPDILAAIALKKELEQATSERDRLIARFQGTTAALQGLKKADFAEVKKYSHPPKGVELCMKAMLILLGQKDTSWENAQHYLITEKNVLQNLTDIPTKYPERITPAKVKKLKVFVEDTPEFLPDALDGISKACVCVSRFIIALYDVQTEASQLSPLEQKIKDIDAKFNEAVAQLQPAERSKLWVWLAKRDETKKQGFASGSFASATWNPEMGSQFFEADDEGLHSDGAK